MFFDCVPFSFWKGDLFSTLSSCATKELFAIVCDTGLSVVPPSVTADQQCGRSAMHDVHVLILERGS